MKPNVRTSLIVLATLGLAFLPVVGAHGLQGALAAAGVDPDHAPVGTILPLVDSDGGFVTPETGNGFDGEKGANGYEIEFLCPPGDGGVQLKCPEVLLDREDVMSQPILMVHPEDVRKKADTIRMASHNMHGGVGLLLPGDESPPTPIGRDNDEHQPHTVWRSTNWCGNEQIQAAKCEEGNIWEDMPYYSKMTGADKIYGTDNAATMDASGRIFIAAGYGWKGENANDPYKFKIIAWKGNDPAKAMDYDVDYRIIDPDPSDSQNRMDNLQMVYVPGENIVVLLFRETAVGGQGIPNPLGGPALKNWVRAFWATSDKSSKWTEVSKDAAIGPCQNITNAIAYDGAVYFGCVADEGYKARPDARPGDIDIHRIKARQNVAEFVSQTPVTGKSAVLALRSYDNAVVIGSAGVSGDGLIFDFAYGKEGAKDWDEAQHFGGKVPVNRTLTDARLNAVAFRSSTGMAHWILWQRYEVDGNNQPGAEAVAEYGKTFIATHQGQTAPVLTFPLDYANPIMPFPLAREGLTDEVFNDHKDSFVLLKDKDGKEFEWIAYGDYGLSRVAVVHEKNRGGFGTPPLAEPIAPVPDPVSQNNAAQQLAGALVGVTMSAAVLRMLLARRKTRVEAPAL